MKFKVGMKVLIKSGIEEAVEEIENEEVTGADFKSDKLIVYEVASVATVVCMEGTRVTCKLEDHNSEFDSTELLSVEQAKKEMQKAFRNRLQLLENDLKDWKQIIESFNKKPFVER